MRFVTYNLFGFKMLKHFEIQDFAGALESLEADCIVLQEVDEGRLKLRDISPVQELAQCLGMKVFYHAVYQMGSGKGGTFGNAILSKHPATYVGEGYLPGAIWKDIVEPRGAMWVEINCDGVAVQVLNTHLSFWPYQQKGQLISLMRDWIQPAHDKGTPLILAGDFNISSRSKLLRFMPDYLKRIKCSGFRPTWPSTRPWREIDHIFINNRMEILHSFTPRNGLFRKLSDHLPVIADLTIKKKVR